MDTTEPDPRPVYPTYEDAVAQARRQERDQGVTTGITHGAGGWVLLCDLTWNPR
jgi:hypothetical protein